MKKRNLIVATLLVALCLLGVLLFARRDAALSARASGPRGLESAPTPSVSRKASVGGVDPDPAAAALGPLVLHTGTMQGLGTVRDLMGRVLKGEAVTVHLQMPNGESLRVVLNTAREIDAGQGVVRGTAADYPMSKVTFAYVRTGIAGEIDLPTIHRMWNIYHREHGYPYAEEVDTIVLSRMQCGGTVSETTQGAPHH